MTQIQMKSGKYRVSHTRRSSFCFSFVVSGFKLGIAVHWAVFRNQKLETRN